MYIIHSSLGQLSGMLKLGIGPKWLNKVSVFDADTNKATLSLPVRNAFEVEAVPHAFQRLDQVSSQLAVVTRGWGDSETFFAAWNGRVVDRLHVDLVVGQEHVGCCLGEFGISDQEGHDVRRVRDHGNTTAGQVVLQLASVYLLHSSVTLVARLILDGRASTGHGGWWQAGGEDETRSERSNSIHKHGRASDVASNTAVGFPQRSCDDVDSVHDGAFLSVSIAVGIGPDIIVEMFSNTGSSWAVHANSMNFVQKGDCTVLVG